LNRPTNRCSCSDCRESVAAAAAVSVAPRVFW